MALGATPIEIANMALSLLGEGAILSLDDPSASARDIRLKFPSVRDSLLRMHPWNFAQARVKLAQLAERPAFGFDFAYQLPNDFLAVSALNGFPEWVCRTDFAIEGNQLLTNGPEANLRYTRRVEDSSLWDALFLECMAVKLAADCAMRITGNMSMVESLTQKLAALTVPLARRKDANEGLAGRRLDWMDSDAIRARSGWWGCEDYNWSYESMRHSSL